MEYEPQKTKYSMAPNKQKREIRKELQFHKSEYEAIAHAAAVDGLPLGQWARQIIVDAATKIKKAHDEVSNAPRWHTYLQSKRFLEERELHL
jgi:hypothetical protein